MHYNSITQKLLKCLLIGVFLLCPIFIMAASINKFKYHSQFTVLDFYLIRLYEVEKCRMPKNDDSKNSSWCLQDFPKVTQSNIELHFVTYKNSNLNKSLTKASPIESKQLIRDGIDDFINYYWHTIGINYEYQFKKQELIDEDKLNKEIILMNQEIKQEENLEKLMDLYFHYCVGDKCYIKKKNISQ